LAEGANVQTSAKIWTTLLKCWETNEKPGPIHEGGGKPGDGSGGAKMKSREVQILELDSMRSQKMAVEVSAIKGWERFKTKRWPQVHRRTELLADGARSGAVLIGP
jgi:hypothetical protein